MGQRKMVAHSDRVTTPTFAMAVGPDKTVQIVAGAQMRVEGLKTIVALPGAMMPDGSLIFPEPVEKELWHDVCPRNCTCQ